MVKESQKTPMALSAGGTSGGGEGGGEHTPEEKGKDKKDKPVQVEMTRAAVGTNSPRGRIVGVQKKHLVLLLAGALGAGEVADPYHHAGEGAGWATHKIARGVSVAAEKVSEWWGGEADVRELAEYFKKKGLRPNEVDEARLLRAAAELDIEIEPPDPGEPDMLTRIKKQMTAPAEGAAPKPPEATEMNVEEQKNFLRKKAAVKIEEWIKQGKEITDSDWQQAINEVAKEHGLEGAVAVVGAVAAEAAAQAGRWTGGIMQRIKRAVGGGAQEAPPPAVAPARQEAPPVVPARQPAGRVEHAPLPAAAPKPAPATPRPAAPATETSVRTQPSPTQAAEEAKKEELTAAQRLQYENQFAALLDKAVNAAKSDMGQACIFFRKALAIVDSKLDGKVEQEKNKADLPWARSQVEKKCSQ